MINLLRQIPLFSSLKDDELDALYKLSYTKQCSKDSIILLENEEGDTLFIILKGKVKVTTFSESGKEVIFSILSEGDFFGDMSLMDGKPRSATVISIEDSELRLIRRNDFIKLVEKHPRIALKLLEELTSRLRKADERIESLAIHDVTGRLAGVLLQLAEEFSDTQDKSILIKSRPTHQELANMVGTTRETVTRILKQLENKKYINMSGKDLLILDSEVFKKDLYF
ncbi:Crp/Fnr family transcriptional regulator [Candidatus Latescibacterota bacterium]